jgi:hypothetical protein
VRGEYTQIQHEHDDITTDAWQGSLDIVESKGASPAGEMAHTG